MNGPHAGVDFGQIERDYVRDHIYAGFRWRPYDSFSPLNPLAQPLPEARVAFVTTAGVHLRDDQPFDVDADEGDPSFRAIPAASSFDELRLTHGGYNTRRAREDMNVVLPLDHLRSAVRDGSIGALTSTVYSFMGYIAETDRLMDEFAPEVARRLVADGADLVLLAPT